MQEGYEQPLDLNDVDKAILKQAKRNLESNRPRFRETWRFFTYHPIIGAVATETFHLGSEAVSPYVVPNLVRRMFDNPSPLEIIAWIGYTWGIPATLGVLVSLYQKTNGRDYKQYAKTLRKKYESEVRRLLARKENSVSE